MKSFGRATTVPELITILQHIVDVHDDPSVTWEGDDNGGLTVIDTDGDQVGYVHSENS